MTLLPRWRENKNLQLQNQCFHLKGLAPDLGGILLWSASYNIYSFFKTCPSRKEVLLSLLFCFLMCATPEQASFLKVTAVIGKWMCLFFQQLCGHGGIFLLNQCNKQCCTELQCPFAIAHDLQISKFGFFGQTVNLLVRVDKLCPGSNKDKFPAIFIIKLHVEARQFESVTWLASSLQILTVITNVYKLICLSYLHVHCMQLAVTAMFY